MIFLDPRKKIITIVLLTVFVLSSSAGAADSMFCIDQDETHIFEQEEYYSVACHAGSAAQPTNEPHHDILSVSKENHEQSCVDIAVSSYGSSIPPHNLKKLVLKGCPLVLSSSCLPQFTLSTHREATVPHFQIYPFALPLLSLSTIVLRI